MEPSRRLSKEILEQYRIKLKIYTKIFINFFQDIRLNFSILLLLVVEKQNYFLLALSSFEYEAVSS